MRADTARTRWRRGCVAIVLALGVVLMHSVALSVAAEAHTHSVADAFTDTNAHNQHDPGADCPNCGSHAHSELCIGNPVVTASFAPPATCVFDSVATMFTAHRSSITVDRAGRDPPSTAISRPRLQIWRV
nr:DUF6153 family protein [Rhodococcus sp. (in: high G+C Gram-positive bacteria)]